MKVLEEKFNEYTLNIRETYDRQKADVKTKQKEPQNMEDSLTQKVITIIIYYYWSIHADKCDYHAIYR